MQPASGKANFQYPQSDRALCNVDTAGAGGAAHDFQYPQSDRALCNWFQFARCGRGADGLSVSPIGSSPLQLHCIPDETRCALPLSVSPIGSSPLQLILARMARMRSVAFSIPNRIEPSATTVLTPASYNLKSLSVSPIGSSPLQPPSRGWPTILARSSFQYPQSDRALCNRFARRCVMYYVEPFSIPNRIEPSATVHSPEDVTDEVSFSIPNRIEPSAT